MRSAGVASDFAELAIQQVQRVCPEAEAKIFDMCDGLPFEDESFGLVNANLSLHYFTMEQTRRIWAEQKPWKIRVLNENEIVRKGRKKYTWEFVWEK